MSATTEEHDGDVGGQDDGGLLKTCWARTVHIGGALVLLLGAVKPATWVAGAATKMYSYAAEGSISLMSALQSPHASLSTSAAQSVAANFRCQGATWLWGGGRKPNFEMLDSSSS